MKIVTHQTMDRVAASTAEKQPRPQTIYSIHHNLPVVLGFSLNRGSLHTIIVTDVSKINSQIRDIWTLE